MGEPAGGQRIPRDKTEDNRRRQESGTGGRSGPEPRNVEKGDRRRDEGGPGQQRDHIDPAAEAWARNPNLSPPIHLVRPE